MLKRQREDTTPASPQLDDQANNQAADQVNNSRVCSLCGREFSLKKYLKNHAAVHSDKRNFECEFCAKTYKYKKGLKRHQKNCKTCKLALQAQQEIQDEARRARWSLLHSPDSIYEYWMDFEESMSFWAQLSKLEKFPGSYQWN